MRRSQDQPNRPRPFGVDYVPRGHRSRPKGGGGILVGKTADIPPGSAKAVETDLFRVAVFNIHGSFYAIKDACPHAEYPLSKGALRDEVVMCASHNWQFNVRTGHCVKGNPDVEVRRFDVEVRGDEVWLKI